MVLGLLGIIAGIVMTIIYISINAFPLMGIIPIVAGLALYGKSAKNRKQKPEE